MRLLEGFLEEVRDSVQMAGRALHHEKEPRQRLKDSRKKLCSEKGKIHPVGHTTAGLLLYLLRLAQSKKSGVCREKGPDCLPPIA